MKRSVQLALVAMALGLPSPRHAIAAPLGAADREFALGNALLRTGNAQAAEVQFKQAAKLYARSGDATDFIWAEIRLAGVYQKLGRVNLAYDTLQQANAGAGKVSDKAVTAALDNALGSLDILASSADARQAEPLLKKSLALAMGSNDLGLAADAANNLGNLYSYRRDYRVAENQYEQAAELAGKANEPTAACRSQGNLARAELEEGNFEKAEKSCATVAREAAELPDSQDKAFLLIGAGDVLNKIYFSSQQHADRWRLGAFEAYQAGAAAAERIRDQRSESYALGYEGQMYEAEKRYEEALTLTRQALFFAQQLQSPDIIYQWEWQVGRLLRAEGDNDAAMAAYRRAVITLQTVRHDVSLHYGNPTAHSSFREVAGVLYSQLSDLLLQKARHAGTQQQQQKYLLEARDTTELLKSAELEDYFQDQCVSLLKSRQTRVESISPTAAVIYIVPLPDRTEMLVTLGAGKIEQVTVGVTDAELTAICNQFRLNLEKRSTDEYLVQADLLYADLIQPLQGLLGEHPIDTLVFVPDGALRTIPMAALRDGNRFLIQKYAIAVTPGLTLMQARPLHEGHVDLIIDAISEGVQGFPPLDNVPEETRNITKMYGGKELLNSDFTNESFSQEFKNADYTIVHIASHGHFDGDSHKTFILTFNNRLGLDDLEQSLRPSQIRDKPVELLTLSACETAAGDDRAALGLAGVAIKAGARSALASLWCVNDEAASVLISAFYAGLKSTPSISKAQALQRAQCKLIADPRYGHPCYWSPYLLIGNWL
jgi:CHAT domain-containing protein